MTQLGESRIEISPLCLGGNTFGWTTDQPASFRVLDEYVNRGGKLIDTADSYSVWIPGNKGGESESVIGSWVAERNNRDQVVIATKVSQLPTRPGLSAANIAAAAEDSLSRLQTDYIDLYYAHQEDTSVPVEESVGAFAELQAAGKIREVGLSNHSPERVREWIAAADRMGVRRPVALQPHYNLVKRDDFEANLAPIAEQFALAVVPYYSLASGLLTGKYRPGEPLTGSRAPVVQTYINDNTENVLSALFDVAQAHSAEPASVAIAWLLAQPTVVAPIASASKPEQLEALFQGVSLELSAEELGLLDRVSR